MLDTIIFAGNRINKEYLIRLIEKTENLIKRKIRYIIFGKKEFETFVKNQKASDLLILWKRED